MYDYAFFSITMVYHSSVSTDKGVSSLAYNGGESCVAANIYMSV